MKTINVPISSIVGSGICVSASDGQRVYEKVHEIITEGNRVALSFSGITRMTTAFLNAAVGQLYGEFSEETVRKHLADPQDYEAWHLARLRLVVDRAKEYFRNSERVERAFVDNMGQHDSKDI